MILENVSKRLLSACDLSFKRYMYDDIDFDARLIVIKGSRGVGKTTLMLQHLKTTDAQSIYFTLDHIYFTSHRLLDLIEELYDDGYRLFAVDEVHKYPNWSTEIKNIYDSYPDIHLVISASNALDIQRGAADLSRRADTYELPGLSFREYLNFEHDMDIKPIPYDEMIADHVDIAHSLYDTGDIKRRFTAYLKHGYYPFFKESKKRYHDRLRSTTNHVIEIDLPPIFSIDYNSIRQLKKLLFLISRISPFTPNISTLSRDLDIPRNSILRFLDFLSGAGLIHLLKSHRKSDSIMAKPDKIYLNNTNLCYAHSMTTPDIGSLRETYFFSALSVTESVSTPVKGDFLVNDQHTIEVGGPSKSFHQLSGMANPILVKDGIDVGSDGIMPLWIFGLLY